MFHKRIDYISIKKSPSVTSLQADGQASGLKRMDSQQSICSEEAFVFHSTSIMMHFTQANMLDEFGNLNVNKKYSAWVSVEFKNKESSPLFFYVCRRNNCIFLNMKAPKVVAFRSIIVYNFLCRVMPSGPESSREASKKSSTRSSPTK